jgi:hypothetical protein
LCPGRNRCDDSDRSLSPRSSVPPRYLKTHSSFLSTFALAPCHPPYCITPSAASGIRAASAPGDSDRSLSHTDHPYIPATAEHTCSLYLPSRSHALGIPRLIAAPRRRAVWPQGPLPFGGTLCSPCHRRSAPHALARASGHAPDCTLACNTISHARTLCSPCHRSARPST